MKVQMINERCCDWVKRNSAPVKAMQPFYEREGKGYVHRVRSARMIFCPQTGKFMHTGVHFWCGGQGFLYPPGRKGRGWPAAAVDSPAPGRVVCATCEARAIGSAQIGNGRVGDQFVRFKPHREFFPAVRNG